MDTESWFINWFNTKHYHLLYNNRNDSEAVLFIKNLIAKYSIKHNSSFWDMACGKGRHCVQLSKSGMDVCGTDLSEQSIEHAKQFESDTLSFYKHDMRNKFRINYFDYVLNIFTSFGYFETEQENISVLVNAESALKKNGIFILDYFNTHSVLENLKPNYEVEKENVIFKINKRVHGNHLIKGIEVIDKDGSKHNYTEKVKLYCADDLKMFVTKSGLEVLDLWGDYTLNKFDKNNSERVIIVAQKN